LPYYFPAGKKELLHFFLPFYTAEMAVGHHSKVLLKPFMVKGSVATGAGLAC